MECSLQVLEEFRVMDVTRNTHAFLHGLETSVPGSYLKGQLWCGNANCRSLEQKWQVLKQKGASWQHCRSMECEICSAERQSRRRVLQESGPSAYALGEASADSAPALAAFKDAPCIVPNNDTRTEINKARSRRFAAEREEQLQWCMAEDVISAKALQIEPELGRRKVEFLRRTDKTCGDLSGIVPLVKQMPVFLTQHVDRDPERNLLKGRRGVVEDWVLDKEEVQGDPSAKEVVLTRPPVCVILFFPGATWQLPGLEPGRYPVQIWKKDWYVDQKQRYPKLRVTRKQLPFCPGFAGTANFAQGQNLGKVFADVSIADGTSGQTCYVALSRVSRRQDIYLLREFPWEMFSKAGKRSPELLLQHLRKEEIDWGRVTDALLGVETDSRRAGWKPWLECQTCGLKPAADFADVELARGRDRQCQPCVARRKEGACMKCEEPLERGGGAKLCQQCASCCEVCGRAVGGSGSGGRCHDCARQVRCECCREWMRSTRRVHQLCANCQDAVECGRCTQMKRKAEYSECAQRAPSNFTRKQHRRCNACLEEDAEVYAEMRRKAWRK